MVAKRTVDLSQSARTAWVTTHLAKTVAPTHCCVGQTVSEINFIFILFTFIQKYSLSVVSIVGDSCACLPQKTWPPHQLRIHISYVYRAMSLSKLQPCGAWKAFARVRKHTQKLLVNVLRVAPAKKQHPFVFLVVSHNLTHQHERLRL